MVAADGDECVVEFANSVEFFHQNSQRRVESHGLAKVVSEVFPHDVNVRQERWHLAFQVVGVESPEFGPRSLNPFSMAVGRAKPVAKRLVVFSCSQEVSEVSSHFFQQVLLRFFNVFSTAHAL